MTTDALIVLLNNYAGRSHQDMHFYRKIDFVKELEYLRDNDFLFEDKKGPSYGYSITHKGDSLCRKIFDLIQNEQ